MAVGRNQPPAKPPGPTNRYANEDSIWKHYYFCHTAYPWPLVASDHSLPVGHHDPSPIFMHRFSPMIAEYRFGCASIILIDDRLWMSWRFRMSIYRHIWEAKEKFSQRGKFNKVVVASEDLKSIDLKNNC